MKTGTSSWKMPTPCWIWILRSPAQSIIAERVGVRPLAIKGEGGEADWVQLSRKHVIEVDESAQHLSIFGGKLTDCLNVGDEVAEWVQRLGIAVPQADNNWYGEPGAELRDEFMLQAKLMDLDALTDPSSSEPLSERFWRRYGESAFGCWSASVRTRAVPNY